MPAAAGTKIGDCEILGLLGSGGMGEVYRARDHSLGREVALKLITEDSALDPERIRRFEQEARAAAALNHPNILAIYRLGTTAEGSAYIISELLEGQSLRQRLEAGSIPRRRVLDYSLQIARGLTAAHERGVVHRDLKPENLFITRDGVVKILDFGLAKLRLPTAPHTEAPTVAGTEAGMVLGTLGYMSPEQLRAQPVDGRSDIFSFGAVLYEMVSGQRAFPGTTAADTISAILTRDPPELNSSGRDVPPALSAVVHRCLEKEPGERFQTARDLAFNLEMLAGTPVSSAIAAVPASAPRKSRTGRRALLAAGAAALLLGVGFAAGRLFAPASVPARPVVLQRLTDFPGMEEFPALAPDGKSVAFTAITGSSRQIWVRLLAGGTPLQVTSDPADHQSPRWSADSSSIIYFSRSDPNAQGKIWQVPALGGTARPLVTSMGAADLSHDGKSLAFFYAEGGHVSLIVADADGTNPRTVAQLPAEFYYSDLRWSPEDTMLAFQRGRTFDYDVLYVPLNGGSPVNITHDASPMYGFTWLPDSSGVIYSSARGDTMLYLPTMNLWSVQLDGKHRRQLTFGETSYRSPDMRHGRVVTSRANVQFDLWKYPVTGSPEENVRQAVQLTHQTAEVQTPSVSPDDSEIAYLSDSGGHGNLWILNLKNGQARQLTFEHDPAIALGVPVWSPKGDYITYVNRHPGGTWNVDLWVVRPDGSDARRIAESGGWACWSADGRWIYYSPPVADGFRIEKRGPQDGRAIVVQPLGEKPAIGPDGTLYFTLNHPNASGTFDMEVLAANPDNAKPHSLATIPGSRLSTWNLMQPVISPDGKWLAMVLTDGPTTNIWGLSTSNGQLRRISDFGTQSTFIARRVSWSADGRSLYAALARGEADIVVISDLLR